MSEERELKDAIDALNKAMELNRKVMESNRQTMELANRLISSFSEAAANLEGAAEKLEALLQIQEEPVAQTTRTKFSPTHEVSNDGDELIKMSTEGGNSYLAYDFSSTGEYKSKTEYDWLYEACLASRKETEYHAMMLQLAQNMAALKQYEYSDEVRDAEQAILDALYDAADAMDEGVDYHGGLDADWDALLANLQKALGLDVPQDEDGWNDKETD